MIDVTNVSIDVLQRRRKRCDRFLICCSGYEQRSRYFHEVATEGYGRRAFDHSLVLGFKSHTAAFSRPSNDAYYDEQGMRLIQADAFDDTNLIKAVKRWLSGLRVPKRSIDLHVDYSSMPRRWYCRFVTAAGSLLQPGDRLLMWYSRGFHTATDFPTAGVDDFELFSGRPSCRRRQRAHVFGLGFDKIRTQAIRQVVDPEFLICYWSDPGTDAAHVRRVMSDNNSIIKSASMTFCVPIDDFSAAYRSFLGVLTDFSRDLDLIVLPDGPKNSVLAASIAAISLENVGVTCFHVRRRKIAGIAGPDVTGTGAPVGMALPIEIGAKQVAWWR